MGVLVASYGTLMVYYWSTYPEIWSAAPLVVALYTAAAAGHLRWPLGFAGLREGLPNGRLGVLEGQEHVVPPEALITVLAEFLAG